MPKMEVFFDYTCPYCLKGHEYLTELAPKYPEIEIIWCPCEAHPRPELRPHSDLMMQGMFFALENGADIWAYHSAMYKAGVTEKGQNDIEDIGNLAGRVEGIVDKAAFVEALKSGTYAEIQQKGNDYAYEESGVWAVPSYRMEGKKLDSVEGAGITKEQLEAFMEMSK